MNRIIFTSILFAIIFSGCAGKKIKSKIVDVENPKYSQMAATNNPNQFRYKPVINTRQEDTKVMIDMGKFAKIWIKNYRNENKTFVASHDIITMIEAPGFIAGEDIPNSKRRVNKQTYGGSTFSYRSSDIVHNSSIEDYELKTSEVKDYVNNYKVAEKFKKLPENKEKEKEKYEKEIEEYLKSKREVYDELDK